MQQITRRPQKKQRSQHKKNILRDRRQKKREAREHQRKLARKLNRFASLIDRGEYEGIKNSPLLQLNWDYVLKRSYLATASMKRVSKKA